MKIVTNETLCELFGLTGQPITRVVLLMEGHKVPVLRVTRLLGLDEQGHTKLSTQRFRLVHDENDPVSFAPVTETPASLR